MPHTPSSHTSIEKFPFGHTPDGPAERFVLSQKDGLEVHITNYGGIITSLLAPDRHGRLGETVLGFDRIGDYLRPHPYLGALVGRYANRIAHGRFRLDGREYRLATNLPPHHLHGGTRGFDKRLWQAEAGTIDGWPALRLRYTSPDGEEGYPGTVQVEVHYTLGPDTSLRIRYRATTDAPTPFNLTQHTYFQLDYGLAADVLEQRLSLAASHYTPTDETLIPLGTLAPVGGTPFDFRESAPLGPRVRSDHPAICLARGLDHNFVLDKAEGALARAARLEAPRSGRVLEVYTTQPGMQVYTANHLDGTLSRNGIAFGPYGAICLETQHFPDSPNQPAFPDAILRPGQVYAHETVWQFSV